MNLEEVLERMKEEFPPNNFLIENAREILGSKGESESRFYKGDADLFLVYLPQNASSEQFRENKVWLCREWLRWSGSQKQEQDADNVNHPAHYTYGKIECIDITENFNFCKGNAIKYIFRAEHKGKEIEDIEKAIWYLQRELKRIKK